MRLRTVGGAVAVGVVLGIAFGILEAALTMGADKYLGHGMFRLAAQILCASLNVNLLIFAACPVVVSLIWLAGGRRTRGGDGAYLRVVLLVLVFVTASRILTWSSLPTGMLPLALKRTGSGILSVLRGQTAPGQFLRLFRRYVDVLIILAACLVALIGLWKLSSRFDFGSLSKFISTRRMWGVAAVLVAIWAGVNIGVLIDRRLNVPAGPNIVLIGIDTLRADHVGCYGYGSDTTPHLDRFAEDAVVFQRAISTSSWTLPSFHSLLTSLYQASHGVANVHLALDRSFVTLAEVLKNGGYTTAGFISGPLLRSLYGFNQGFDFYDESVSTPSRLGSDKVVTSPDTDDLVRAWLGENADRPFFLFIHYWDPHHDYIPPAPYDSKFDPYYEGWIDGTNINHSNKINLLMKQRDLEHVVALYDGEICWTDRHLGNLFGALSDLGVYDNTLVVVVADHGEEFLDHGGKLHTRTLYEEVIHVPLLFRFPDTSGRQVVESAVSIVDVMPTILDFLDIPNLANGDGESLLPMIEGACEERQTTELYSELKNDLACIVDGPWKLIHNLKNGRNELYNTYEDTLERYNLIDKQPERAADLYWKLARWRESKQVQGVKAPAAARDSKTTKDLKSLGYIQ